MKSGKMMRIVSEFEELNKAVRAPNDANGCTARSSHVAEDERMALAPLVKLRERRINRISSGTMRRRKWVRGTAGVRTQWNDRMSHQPYKKRHVDQVE